MAKMLGARVFGTVSTEEKAALTREAGCDEVIFYTKQDFETEVRRLTDGRGVDVIYDPVGGPMFDQLVRSLAWNGRLLIERRRGRMPNVPL